MPQVDYDQQASRTTVGQIAWPQPGAVYPTQQWPPQYRPPKYAYANRVEIARNQHDAIISFFRDGAQSGEKVAEITVPLSVLEGMAT